MRLPSDNDLGPLLSMVVFTFTLCVAFLVVLLGVAVVVPGHGNLGVIAGAVAVIVPAIVGIVHVRLRGRTQADGDERG